MVIKAAETQGDFDQIKHGTLLLTCNVRPKKQYCVK